jgi:hypothetical protein
MIPRTPILVEGSKPDHIQPDQGRKFTGPVGQKRHAGRQAPEE